MSCPHPRKVPYASRREALSAMSRANILFGADINDAYKCRCKAWHLTGTKNANRGWRGEGVEVDAAGLRAFLEGHGLSATKLAAMAGVPADSVGSALCFGRVPANDLPRVQEAMARVLGEARERKRRAGVT